MERMVQMANAYHQMDDDIFTLKEDASAQRRAHALQYALISVFAVVVLSVALYLSFWLTDNRLANRTTIELESKPIEMVANIDPNYNPNFWPAHEFPELPKIEAATYETRMDPAMPGRAEVTVPMSTAMGFVAYAEQLAEDGAKIFIKTRRLTVVAYKGIELHLMCSTSKNMVVLCREPQIDFMEPEYAQFPVPDVGKLVSVGEATGEKSRVLTYRLASPEDAIGYASELRANGWMMVGTIMPKDQTFTYAFKKDGPDGGSTMQISVDYFSASDNYRIRFDIIPMSASLING